MDDFDLRCLPTDFVATSKPSKVIARFYERHKKAERKAIEAMNIKKQEICEKYENLMKNHKDELKVDLQELKGIINEERRNALDNFTTTYSRIQGCTQQQHEIIKSFYDNMEEMEKDKSNELKENLKQTYEAIKSSSYKLPSEYNEFVELEVEKINQSILCNTRNYLELYTRLQAETEIESGKIIQNLKQFKETLIRMDTKKDFESLKQRYTSDFTQAVRKAKRNVQKTNIRLRSLRSATLSIDPNKWLNNTRQELALLDKNTQKLILNYKHAAILIYKKHYQELTNIQQALRTETVPKSSFTIPEYYTPSLEEIKYVYDVDLETIQKLWDHLVEEMRQKTDKIYRCLLAAVTLWERHFKRTKKLEVLILKDLEYNIQLNNDHCEPYEIHLNKLIDTLRQSTQENAMKYFKDIKDYLVSMEDLYKEQHQAELGVLKKYKSTHELKIDILLAEINRFLKVYPPNFEKDPKIQRKRESKMSQLDITDSFIPNQMMFCKFQVEALANWQYGLWESIKNYTTRAKTELMAEADKWTRGHFSSIDLRLKMRMAVRNMRLTKIEEYIYRERLEELHAHRSRFDEHLEAVKQQLKLLETEYELCHDKCKSIAKAHEKDITEIQFTSIEAESSQMVSLHKIVVKNRTEKCIKEITDRYSNYWEKCDKCINRLKAINIVLVENIKLFSEEGNFSVPEVKAILIKINKIKQKMDTVLNNIEKQMDPDKESIIEEIQNTDNDVMYTIKYLMEEHQFRERLAEKLKKLQRELLRMVSATQYKVKCLTEQFAKFKEEAMKNCGNYACFLKYSEDVQDLVPKLIAMAEYMNNDLLGRMYSDKIGKESKFKPNSSIPKARKNDIYKVRQITTKLFNFKITENSYFMDLTRILRNYWNEIIVYGKPFYDARKRCFYLDGELIHHSLPLLMKHMYGKFLNMQIQSETQTMTDTQKYLEFASDCLVFIELYIGICTQEYTRKALRNFEQLFEENIRKRSIQTIKEISNRYQELQKKLKPSYGFKNNKKLLEKIQIEAEIIHGEAKDFLRDIKVVQVKSLNEQRHKIADEYTAFRVLIPDIKKAIEALRTAVDILSGKLERKVNNLKTMMRRCSARVSISDSISEHHRKRGESILVAFDAKSHIDLTRPGLRLTVSSVESGGTWNDYSYSTVSLHSLHSVPSSMSSSSFHNSERTISMVTHYTINTVLDPDVDMFLIVLKETHDNYCRQLISKTFENFLENLKHEWNCAVCQVMNLYCVKYD